MKAGMAASLFAAGGHSTQQKKLVGPTMGKLKESTTTSPFAAEEDGKKEDGPQLAGGGAYEQVEAGADAKNAEEDGDGFKSKDNEEGKEGDEDEGGGDEDGEDGEAEEEDEDDENVVAVAELAVQVVAPSAAKLLLPFASAAIDSELAGITKIAFVRKKMREFIQASLQGAIAAIVLMGLSKTKHVMVDKANGLAAFVKERKAGKLDRLATQNRFKAKTWEIGGPLSVAAGSKKNGQDPASTKDAVQEYFTSSTPNESPKETSKDTLPACKVPQRALSRTEKEIADL
jgi:hypothetical protein